MKKILKFSLLSAFAIILSLHKSLALENCPGTPTSDIATYLQWNNCNGTISTAKGSYSGQVLDGKAHGLGVRTFSSTSDLLKYEGGWQLDIFHGFGTLIYRDGREYKGNWSNGRKNGPGMFKFSKSESYDGNWLDNQPNGFGTYIFSNGDYYVGAFKNGQKHGNGKYFHQDGKIYEGQFRFGSRYGQGRLEYSDGSVYQGEWRNGEQAGQGLWRGIDGSSYEGEWREGAYFGKGTLVYSDGSVYQGEWRNGEQAGQGLWRGIDGSSYEGEWREGAYFGKGTLIFQNGDHYKGYFKHGKFEGRGTFIMANGEFYQGEWRQNNRTGFGLQYFTNGDLYEGKFSNDKMNGQGSFTWANGDVFTGEFLDNKKHGLGRIKFISGDEYFGEWRFDKFYGSGTLTYADGSSVEGSWEGNNFQEIGVEKELAEEPKINTVFFSSGSGFSISKNGHVVTNNHVIDGCREVFIHTKDEKFLSKTVAFDAVNDLAILKGDFSSKHAFSLASDSSSIMEDVYVAGYPFGKNVSTSIKVTKGIISSLTGIGNNFSNIQIDAAMQPGNSGGPIIDKKGNVIGVAVAKLDLEYTLNQYGVIPEGTNFGIKASVVKSMLESNGITTIPAQQNLLSNSKLGQIISDGTFYLSCWMTEDQVDQINKISN